MTTRPDADRFTDWVTSSRTAGSGQCVQIAKIPGWIAVRDSKDPTGPAIVIPAATGHAWIKGIKDGGGDLP